MVSLRFAIGLGLMLLTACTGPFSNVAPLSVYHAPPGNQDLPWPVRMAQLRSLKNWQVQGSLGIHNHHHKGASLSFSWEQTPVGYRLLLWGPFNQPFIEIESTATGVCLQTNNKIYEAKEAEILIHQQLGIKLPIGYFTDWLRGLPSPRRRSERVLNGTNHLLKLHQAGWMVRYLKYNKIRYLDLPTQMLMIHGPWYARVIVTHWKI